VIYLLLDTKGRRFNLGEAVDLVKRLQQRTLRLELRYNVLPSELAPLRALIERMLVRDFAAVLKNERQIASQEIAGCELANDKVGV